MPSDWKLENHSRTLSLHYHEITSFLFLFTHLAKMDKSLYSVHLFQGSQQWDLSRWFKRACSSVPQISLTGVRFLLVLFFFTRPGSIFIVHAVEMRLMQKTENETRFPSQFSPSAAFEPVWSCALTCTLQTRSEGIWSVRRRRERSRTNKHLSFLTGDSGKISRECLDSPTFFSLWKHWSTSTHTLIHSGPHC